MRPNFTVREFLESLREGPFTSIGCYPLYWATAAGDSLSHAACKANALRIARNIRLHERGKWSESEWRVWACDANWEDPAMFCADTGERIESAYGEDRAEQA